MTLIKGQCSGTHLKRSLTDGNGGNHTRVHPVFARLHPRTALRGRPRTGGTDRQPDPDPRRAGPGRARPRPASRHPARLAGYPPRRQGQLCLPAPRTRSQRPRDGATARPSPKLRRPRGVGEAVRLGATGGSPSPHPPARSLNPGGGTAAPDRTS